MGWLHVDETGDGVYLNSIFEKINDYDSLCQVLDFSSFHFGKEDIAAKYPDFTFPHLDEYSKTDLALLAGLMANYMQYDNYQGGTTASQMSVVEMKEFVNRKWRYSDCVVESLALIFAKEYGYPADAFRSVSDYNCDYMFFCTATIPIQKGWECLAKLTEDVYQHQLDDFFSRLTGEEYHAEIYLCEEYIKE